MEGRGLHDGAGPGGRVAGLEDPGADEDAVGTKLHHHRRVGRGGDPAGGEQHHGQTALAGDLADQRQRRLQLLGRDVELVLAHRGQPTDLPSDGAHVGRGLADVARAGLALGADHGRALAEPAQRLAQVGGPADERHRELPLVDVVGVVGR